MGENLVRTHGLEKPKAKVLGKDRFGKRKMAGLCSPAIK